MDALSPVEPHSLPSRQGGCLSGFFACAGQRVTSSPASAPSQFLESVREAVPVVMDAIGAGDTAALSRMASAKVRAAALPACVPVLGGMRTRRHTRQQG